MMVKLIRNEVVIMMEGCRNHVGGEGKEERRDGGLVSDSREGWRKRNVELIVRIERILDKIKI